MNTLEVTYADKAGRLIEGSPDKTKIEELQAQVQELQGKSLKIYIVNRDEDALTDSDIKYIIDNNIEVVYCNLTRYTVNHELESNILYLDGVDGGNLFHRNKYKVYPDNEWGFDNSQVIDLNDVKPIYFHPVVTNDADSQIGFSIIILNNDPAPIDSWDKLKAYFYRVMTSLGDTARFPATGSFVYNNEAVPCRNIDVMTNNNIRIFGYTAAGNNVYIDIQSLTIRGVYDGVNKLN